MLNFDSHPRSGCFHTCTCSKADRDIASQTSKGQFAAVCDNVYVRIPDTIVLACSGYRNVFVRTRVNVPCPGNVYLDNARATPPLILLHSAEVTARFQFRNDLVNV
ncbi:hypothetical protein TcasGA2_TC031434 [Tribolium castaneum]|uniref:Uncharacterized protein n=1 Tax=Tribolium castaneum TaxID=7070 RepID=A0A139WAL1_TRICA|nr:hypothetical protein TcasGA2_TC031434 [Tribolium castaneum]